MAYLPQVTQGVVRPILAPAAFLFQDVRLNSASPLLADTASCGQIGALGVGRGVTPTLVQRFTAGRAGPAGHRARPLIAILERP